MSSLRETVRRGCVFAGLAVLAACSSWHQVERHDGWTLYSEKGSAVDTGAFRTAFDPAHRTVEEYFGPFRSDVRVHALPNEGEADESIQGTGIVHEVPGIGRARVRAYHARGDGFFGPASGIYAVSPDAGTAAHELVHARLAEEAPDLPLWFEEGLACVIGDGVLDGERWIVDGYACWPVRELREQRLTDTELAHVLQVGEEESTSVRDNVLVHFVGWAIVFDLYRESGAFDWRAWQKRYGAKIDLAEARRRLERSTSTDVESEWLKRLSSPDRSVRLATAKGVWKLRSSEAITALLDALDREEDGELKVSFAVNTLAAAGEMKIGWELQDRLWRTVWPVLKRCKLDDVLEQSSLKNLLQSFRWRSNVSSQQALEGLRRFWAE